MTERALRLRSDPTRPILPLWIAVLLALAAGPMTDAAFPDRGWWPMAFPGIACVLLGVVGRRFWSAALVGFVFGMSYYLVQITWASEFLGPVPMTALAFACAAYLAIGSGLIAWAYRWLPRIWRGTLGRLVLLPLAVAGLWTAREATNSVWPYGGFAWGRMGQAMVDSPIAPLYAWIGISGMTFVMVWLVAAVIEAVRYSGVDRLRRAVAPLGIAAALLLWPAWPVTTTGTMRIGMVQGDGPAGYFESKQPGDLLAAQYEATIPLFEQQADADLDLDLVLWPEGSSEWDPQTNATAAAVWDDVSERLDAPLLAQAVTERGDAAYNTLILWQAGEGALDTYDKRHPVPFGEYMPDRAFYRALAPALVDLVGRDYTPGTTDAVMTIGGVTAAVNICYDIVDDGLLRESVRDGGRLILASSNNADFGPTDESAQQLAIARIRAIELGRAVANVSTVGITAVIGADGKVVDRLPWYGPGVIVADVPLSDGLTPDAVAGWSIEIVAGGIGFALLIWAGLAGGAARRDGYEDFRP